MSRPLLLFAVLLCGCAATSPPLHRGGDVEVDLEDGSVAFASVRISNGWKPKYLPELKLAILTWTDDDGDIETRTFEIEPAHETDPAYGDYLISFQLDPDDWTLQTLIAQSAGIINGNFIVRLNQAFVLPERRFVYLGHFHANVVERTRNDQPRAGPLIPAIEQSAAGASTGTFVIRVEDRFDADVAIARREYGLPADAEVLNQALTPPTR